MSLAFGNALRTYVTWEAGPHTIPAGSPRSVSGRQMEDLYTVLPDTG